MVTKKKPARKARRLTWLDPAAQDLQSDRDKDAGDVREMFERGMFQPAAVHKIMLLMGDQELADRFWSQYGR